MTSNRLSALLFATLFIVFEGCLDIGEAEFQPPPAGTFPAEYNYKGYDADGSLAVTGKLVLALSPDSSVSGSWTFVAVSGSKNLGPQIGSGMLVGNIRNARIFVNLNPGWVDNNVYLFGSVGSNNIAGTWTWSTFIGPTASGRFETSPTLWR